MTRKIKTPKTEYEIEIQALVTLKTGIDMEEGPPACNAVVQWIEDDLSELGDYKIDDVISFQFKKGRE